MTPGQTQGTPELELRDIHLPELPGIWPPAPGWWIVALLLLVICFYCGRIIIKTWRRRQQKKQILALLDTLENEIQGQTDTTRLAELSRLMKRLAITRFPNKKVSSLSGRTWLEFLDETGGGGMFSNSIGQVLASGPYAKSIEQQPEWSQLSALIRKWVATNA